MAEPQRLHPASPVFNIVRHARTLLIPGIAVLFVGGDSWQLYLMLLFVPSAVFEVIRFFTFRYRLTDDQIVTTLVFIGRTERSLRYERIQNIESVQGVFHRMLGVAEIRVETGAGGKPEAVLRVVPATEVSRIRERVFADRRAGADHAGDATTTDAPLLTLSGLDFMRLGLITMRGLVLLALALGAAWELDLFDRLFSARAWLLERLPAIGEHATDVTIGLATVSILGLIAGLLVLASVAWAVLRFGGFRLTRSGDDFRVEAGLLTRVNATVPRHRIQLVRLTQSFQHRRFERAAIALETAGGVSADTNEESSFGRKWFAPLVRPEAIPRIAGAIHPALSLDADGWSRLSARAQRRLLRKSIIVATPIALAIAGGTFAFLWPWGPAAGLVLGALMVFYGRRSAALARYQRTAEWIGCRAGVMTRHTSVALIGKAQVIEVSQSPFDRRAGMATLRVDTAGGLAVTPRVDLPMLETSEAHTHARALAEAAERAGLRW